MSKIARMRFIELLRDTLLQSYKTSEPNSPEQIKRSTEIIEAFRNDLMVKGKSKSTINDYISCGLKAAIMEYEKYLGVKSSEK